MNREEKSVVIKSLNSEITEKGNFYLTDISGLNVEQSNNFRRLLFSKDMSVSVVKNTLLKKCYCYPPSERKR